MTAAPHPTRHGRGLRALLTAATLAVAVLSGDVAQAAEAPISVGEITPPPPGLGVDASVLRASAVEELRHIDASRVPRRRKIVVALSVTKAVADRRVACTVNAMLRDARTGAMIAIIEAGASADGPGSVEVRKQVASAAVRSAVRRIPRALGGR